MFVPAKEGFKGIDLGVPTFGETYIDSEIYNRLRSEGEILESISPAVIKEKYLSDKDYVETRKLLEAFLKTPGEMRIVSSDAFKEGTREGVEKALFGLGNLEDGTPKCEYFKEGVSPELSDNEIIIKSELCVKETGPAEGIIYTSTLPSTGKEEKEEEKTAFTEYTRINLKLNVPRGQMSNIVKVVNYLNKNKLFKECNLTMSY